MVKNYKLLAMGSLVVFLFLFYYFENPYALTSSEFIVSGTSNLRAWELISTRATGEGEIEISNNSIQEIHSLKIQIPAESLKSGNNALYNTAYSALRTQKHKNITFALNKVRKIENRNGISVISANGSLSVAGITQPVLLTVTGKVQNQQVLFEGSHSLRMADFNIEPPSALLGTVRADDEITVSFKVFFNPQSQFL